VFVGDQVIATRGGSLLARFFGGGWPDAAGVVATLKARAVG
jgi:hypothetical protein